MIYRINDWTLDCHLRSLTNGDKERHIRPRTLALLLYFIEHRNELIASERLLEHVWDDVGVSDGVVVQSIREIRQLLDNPNVIVNFPRKGYQFTGNVVSVESTRKKYSDIIRQRPFGFLTLFIVMLVGLYLAKDINTNTAITINSHSRAFAPYEAALSNDMTSMKLLPKNIETLKLDIYGDTAEFAAIYSAKFNSREIQGIVFTAYPKSIPSQIAEEIVKQSRAPNPANVSMTWNQEFIDAFLIYERDWKAALGTLENLLPRFPDSLRLKYFLVKLYIWNESHFKAQEILDSIAPETTNTSWQMRFGYLRAKSLFVRGKFEDALAVLSQAEELSISEQNWDQLALLSDLQGDINYQAANNVEALRAFQRAEKMYLNRGNQTGLAAVRLKMSVLYIATQQLTLAKRAFSEAERSIAQYQIKFLYPMQTEIWEANRAYLTEVSN
ncbi:winged helix-turn-helix domain-containing protein [Alteromonas antoniana]|uniref:winged helix-turn-helix domain-containing protein n=1 Tax=Alteromonas antoniana TaxID=2803813 RepID=UPI00237C2D92|nr:winged helix-turn-helix domain-containing protein [Alteromonas antoniana]